VDGAGALLALQLARSYGQLALKAGLALGVDALSDNDPLEATRAAGAMLVSPTRVTPCSSRPR
jgi:hypothetical protein